jgi:Ca2+-binding RTX toxin-like protein
MSNAIANQLFLAYLGRPASKDWRDATGDLVATQNGQPSPALLTAMYNAAVADGVVSTTDSPANLVNKIFQQIFGFGASTFEQTEWGKLIINGTIPVQSAAWTIFSSYLNVTSPDPAVQASIVSTYRVPAQSKLIAAEAYVAQLANDSAANLAVSQIGSAAATSARTFLSGITTQAQAATAVTNIATTVASVGTSTTGSTFALTTGVDNITGTTANDTINGLVDYTAGGVVTSASTTFSAVDTINGGAGTADTLNLTVTGSATGPSGGVTLPAATVSAVETVNVRAVTGSGQVITVSGANFSGHTSINTDRSTDAVTVTNLATGASFGMVGNGTVALGNVQFGYATATAAAALNVSNGVGPSGTTAPTVGLNGSATAVTIASTGSANTIGAVNLDQDAGGNTVTGLTVNAATNLTTGAISNFAANSTITVSGAATTVNLNTINANVTTVNASGLTAGGLTATMSATTTLAVTGGTGNDTITTGSVLTTGSVAAGSGTDRLNVANSDHLATAALGAKYTGFETLAVADGVAVDLDNISGITSLVMTDAAGTTSLTNLSSTQAAAVTLAALNGAATIGVKNAATVGQLDTVTITVSDGDSTTGEALTTAGNLTIASVETINFAAVDNLQLATIANMNSFTTVNLSGAGTSEVYTAASAVVLNAAINGSTATGAVRVNATQATTNGMALTGGSGNDQLTGSAQADALVGGAGNDVLFGLAAADTVSGGAGNDFVSGGAGADTLTGGDGADTFELTQDGATTVDTIADLVLGTDLIAVTAAPTGGVVTSVFAATGASLAAAAADAGTSIGASKAGIFTYSGNSYLLVNDGTAGTIDANDLIVKITGYTGTLATSTFSTTGATIVGVGGAAQTITGTVGVDTITGTNGASDSITAGSGADSITVTETTAAADTVFYTSTTLTTMSVEGGDTITGFAAAAGADIISFATAALENGTETTTLLEIASNGTVTDNSVLVEITTAAAAGAADTAAEVVTHLTGMTFQTAVATNDKLVFALNDGTDTYLWYFQSDATAALSAAEFTLAAKLVGVTNLNNGDLTYA